MQLLFPDIKPYERHSVAVDDIHTLYVEECGDPEGIPILFLHGGPGAGFAQSDRRFFDPEKYRIILFDQRGAGKSQPHAELTSNTTQDLLNDIETLRKHLNVSKWVLFGGSWGATLALLYAESFPDRVNGMILRGAFLSRQADLKWFYQEGADRIFPDYWKDYIHPIAEENRDNLLAAYYEKLTGSNQIAQMAAAKAWSLWEGRCATLRPNPEVVHTFSEPHLAVSLARIETHYFVNNSFIDENQIIENANQLEGIPGIIIHGRYDMVCPLDNAFTLHRAWQDSELHIIRDAGHSSREPGIIDALVKATENMAHRISGLTHHTS